MRREDRILIAVLAFALLLAAIDLARVGHVAESAPAWKRPAAAAEGSQLATATGPTGPGSAEAIPR